MFFITVLILTFLLLTVLLSFTYILTDWQHTISNISRRQFRHMVCGVVESHTLCNYMYSIQPWLSFHYILNIDLLRRDSLSCLHAVWDKHALFLFNFFFNALLLVSHILIFLFLLDHLSQAVFADLNNFIILLCILLSTLLVLDDENNSNDDNNDTESGVDNSYNFIIVRVSITIYLFRIRYDMKGLTQNEFIE